MLSDELAHYIGVRGGQLSSDEILQVIDTDRNPQIKKIIYDGYKWEVQTNDERWFSFIKRDWR